MSCKASGCACRFKTLSVSCTNLSFCTKKPKLGPTSLLGLHCYVCCMKAYWQCPFMHLACQLLTVSMLSADNTQHKSKVTWSRFKNLVWHQWSRLILLCHGSKCSTRQLCTLYPIARVGPSTQYVFGMSAGWVLLRSQMGYKPQKAGGPFSSLSCWVYDCRLLSAASRLGALHRHSCLRPENVKSEVAVQNSQQQDVLQI